MCCKCFHFEEWMKFHNIEVARDGKSKHKHRNYIQGKNEWKYTITTDVKSKASTHTFLLSPVIRVTAHTHNIFTCIHVSVWTIHSLDFGSLINSSLYTCNWNNFQIWHKFSLVFLIQCAIVYRCHRAPNVWKTKIHFQLGSVYTLIL